jgi:hypothetical protein
MGTRIRSAPFLRQQHSVAQATTRGFPTQASLVHHLANRYQAMSLLGLSAYVLSTSTHGQGDSLTPWTMVGGYRGGQVRGTSLIHACHASYGQPKIGDRFLRDCPRSPAIRYFLKRLLSWTDLLHVGVNHADSLSEGLGLVKAGERFLKEIASAARGKSYDKRLGSLLVRDAFYDVLVPESRKAYFSAGAAFDGKQTHSELITKMTSSGTFLDPADGTPGEAPSPHDEYVAGTYIGNWVERGGMLVPPQAKLQASETEAVTAETLECYEKFGDPESSRSQALSSNPPVLEKQQTEAVIEYVASNESKSGSDSAGSSTSSDTSTSGSSSSSTEK